MGGGWSRAHRAERLLQRTMFPGAGTAMRKISVRSSFWAANGPYETFARAMPDLPDITPFRRRLDELDAQLADPNLFADPRRAAKVSRDQQRLSRLVQNYDAVLRLEKQIAEARGLLRDPQADADLRELAEMELPENEARVEELEREVLIGMIPPDPTDSRNTDRKSVV